MASNAGNSPLLRLPHELKRIIWKEVIGESIHIYYQEPELVMSDDDL